MSNENDKRPPYEAYKELCEKHELMIVSEDHFVRTLISLRSKLTHRAIEWMQMGRNPSLTPVVIAHTRTRSGKISSVTINGELDMQFFPTGFKLTITDKDLFKDRLTRTS